MATIQIVPELVEVIKALPTALKELSASQAKARSDILTSVTDLAEAVSQAFNVVSVRCGQIILKKDDLADFKKELVESPQFLDEFRLKGVCATLGKVRGELRTSMSMKRLSLRLFYKKKLENLLEQIQNKERDLEEDFDTFFRDLSRRGPNLKKGEMPEIIQYLRDFQAEFESDVQTIRQAMRSIESSL